MSNVAALLDKAKKARSIPSDNAFAVSLGLRRQVISQWRSGDSYPSEEHIAQLADMAGDDPVMWLVSIKAERTEGAAGRAWARLAKQLSTAAVLAVVAALPLTSQAAVSAGKFAGNAYYVLRRWMAPRLAIPSRATLSPA